MDVLIDTMQREMATDPLHSYIVQAPAGSGKTEILTQRYLRLLSIVNAPEQIVALTFTRKAANEMRERILLALFRAANGIKPTSAHLQKTHDLAMCALERDKELKWHLLQQPASLRINTIDALCQTISNAIPLQESQVHYASISDKPEALYRGAALECLRYAMQEPIYHASLKILLQHLDNQQNTLIDLFCDLLANRAHWLSLLYHAKKQDKDQFEAAIDWILQHEIACFKKTLPLEYADELVTLARSLACIEGNPDSKRYLLRDWMSFDTINGSITASLASLLLTSQGTFRKSFDHHVGLKRSECSNADYDHLKSASKILLAKLNDLPDFLNALLRVSTLPEPQYDTKQWDVLQALFQLLPLLVAHLNIIFNQQAVVDFEAISELALCALGTELAPTDLALYLDNQIKHLLIDEFQDTSIQQFQLINQLVQGWEPHDGRTLFLVGDPMQSIYRFRSAEVGLFLRTWAHGLGPVKLTPLELRCNFRSKAPIVNWVNQQFKLIFPKSNDIESGAVLFHSSECVQPTDNDSFVCAHHFEEKETTAISLVNTVIEELQTYPDDTIAILVRTRRQLTEIISQLRARAIPFQGVDIDLLANLPHIRDVWSLTKALLMPANRLAWLSYLRSPWCGLSLIDLHALANYSKSKSIYFAMSKLDTIQTLSTEGRLRLQFIFTVLQTMLAARAQLSLVDWILLTLQHLHLDNVLTPQQQDELEQYWILLEQFEQEGQIADFSLFKHKLNTLYSKKVTPSRLQIMTIHKSKGLEFDCVFLPGLSSKSANRSRPLFHWLQLPTEHEPLFLLSPMKAADSDECPLYDYLSSLNAQKEDYESQRLLYVAATRAKKRLYLFDHSQTIREGSFRHLLQHQTFSDPNPDLLAPAEEPNKEQAALLPALYRLPDSFYQPPPLFTTNYTLASKLQLSDSTPRLLGIITHELLQWICTYHPKTYNEIPWQIGSQRLLALGFQDDALQIAMSHIKEQLLTLFSDPIGQWIIKPHTAEQNEYELLIKEKGAIATRIIDRTFIDDGIRWIIDFKTGHENQSNAAHHRKQVNEYAALLEDKSNEPIHCGLYYLASGHWVVWESLSYTLRT